jgi:hypothetical protein
MFNSVTKKKTFLSFLLITLILFSVIGVSSADLLTEEELKTKTENIIQELTDSNSQFYNQDDRFYYMEKYPDLFIESLVTKDNDELTQIMTTKDNDNKEILTDDLKTELYKRKKAQGQNIFQDLANKRFTELEGWKIDSETGEKTPIATYQNPITANINDPNNELIWKGNKFGILNEEGELVKWVDLDDLHYSTKTIDYEDGEFTIGYDIQGTGEVTRTFKFKAGTVDKNLAIKDTNNQFIGGEQRSINIGHGTKGEISMDENYKLTLKDSATLMREYYSKEIYYDDSREGLPSNANPDDYADPNSEMSFELAPNGNALIKNARVRVSDGDGTQLLEMSTFKTEKAVEVKFQGTMEASLTNTLDKVGYAMGSLAVISSSARTYLGDFSLTEEERMNFMETSTKLFDGIPPRLLDSGTSSEISGGEFSFNFDTKNVQMKGDEYIVLDTGTPLNKVVLEGYNKYIMSNGENVAGFHNQEALTYRTVRGHPYLPINNIEFPEIEKNYKFDTYGYQGFSFYDTSQTVLKSQTNALGKMPMYTAPVSRIQTYGPLEGDMGEDSNSIMTIRDVREEISGLLGGRLRKKLIEKNLPAGFLTGIVAEEMEKQTAQTFNQKYNLYGGREEFQKFINGASKLFDVAEKNGMEIPLQTRDLIFTAQDYEFNNNQEMKKLYRFMRNYQSTSADITNSYARSGNYYLTEQGILESQGNVIDSSYAINPAIFRNILRQSSQTSSTVVNSRGGGQSVSEWPAQPPSTIQTITGSTSPSSSSRSNYRSSCSSGRCY